GRQALTWCWQTDCSLLWNVTTASGPTLRTWHCPVCARTAANESRPPRVADDMTHFGDPFAEQKLLAAGEGWVALPQRAVLRLTGADRITWLDSLTSHRIESDSSTQALILDPNGHVEYDLHVVDAGGTTWLIVDAASVDALHTYLDRMRFLADVAVTDVSDEYDVVWVPRREEHEDLPTWLV